VCCLAADSRPPTFDSHWTAPVISSSVVAGTTPAQPAQPAPLMTVLIKPGVMSEAVGKGNLDVTMTIPGVDVAAGAPFLSMDMFVPDVVISYRSIAENIPAPMSFWAVDHTRCVASRFTRVSPFCTT